MKRLIAFLCLLPSLCLAQGAHRIGQVLVKGNGIVANVSPYAKIQVCVTGTGCKTETSIYLDPALTILAQNPVTADGAGNYDYYIPAGCVDEQISNPGSPSIFIPYVCPNNGQSGGVATITSISPIVATTSDNVVTISCPTCGSIDDGVLLDPSGPQTITGFGLAAPSFSAQSYFRNGTGAMGTALGYIPHLLCNGDSITYGFELNTPLNSFCYRVGASLNTEPVNLGVPGVTTGGYWLFLYQNPTIYSNTSMHLDMLGTNDVSQAGADANQIQDFAIGTLARYGHELLSGGPRFTTAQATPPAGITLTYGGTWSNSTVFGSGDGGKICVGTACSATVTFTGPLLYLATPMITANTAAAATITCDGTPTGVTPIFTGVGTGTLFQSTVSMSRVSLSNAAHSCVLQSTSTTGTMGLQWLATPTGATDTSTPYVIANSIPTRFPDTVTATYRPFQVTAVNTLKSDGFANITYVDITSAYASAVTSFFDGAVHPIDINHYNMAVIDVPAISTLLGTQLSLPPIGLGGGVHGGLIVSGNQDVNFGDGAALAKNTTGAFNTACPNSGANNTTGGELTTCGANAGSGNTTGIGNTWNGANAGTSNATTSFNTCIGNNCLPLLTSGGANTGAGNQVGGSITLGTEAALFGDQAGVTTNSANTLSRCIFCSLFGANSGASVPTATTAAWGVDWGVFGDRGLVGAVGSYEIGTGNCALANSLCFKGNPFVDSANNGTFVNVTSNTGGSITGINYVVGALVHGYTAADVVTLLQFGSSSTATVTVNTIANGFAGPSTITAAGTGYSTLATTYPTSCVTGTCSGSGMTVQIGNNSGSPNFGCIALRAEAGGSGYTNGDTYTVVAPGASGCNFTIATANGVPTSVTLTSGGFAYNLTGALTDSGGSGTGLSNNLTITSVSNGAGCYFFGSSSGAHICDSGAGMDFSPSGPVAFLHPIRVDQIIPISLYSAAGTPLPSCASGINGEQATVSDANTPTYMGAYTSGGAITASVICSFNGTSYSWVTH